MEAMLTDVKHHIYAQNQHGDVHNRRVLGKLAPVECSIARYQTPKHTATSEPEELQQHLPTCELILCIHHLLRDEKDYNSASVVEQRLSLDHVLQMCGRTERVQHTHHRHRVCGRED